MFLFRPLPNTIVLALLAWLCPRFARFNIRSGLIDGIVFKMQDCDTLATIKLDDTLIQRAVAMFHSGSMQCSKSRTTSLDLSDVSVAAKDLWEPFEYLDHSEPLVHLVLNPATLRFAVEPRWHGVPVS